jgi:hypothetical protein
VDSRIASFWRDVVGRDPSTVLLATFAAAAWVATHRYHGVWHDGVLYAGQAISRIDPAPFTKDLFFAYGSQDGFTVFTWFYALAIKELGLPTASKVLLGMAHLAWLSAAAWLLRGVLSRAYYWLALVLVAVLPGGYGAFGIFAYGEPFLTARIWAEPPALLAVACILRGRRVGAFASLVFAAAMHPVMTFPAALFVLFFGFPVRQQLVVALAGLASLAILSAVGVPPFANLTKTMDPIWLNLSTDRSPFVFIDHWNSDEYCEPILLAVLLTTVALISSREVRRLWWCALGVLVVGMGLSILAVYWPSVLLIQIQPWRVLWLTKVLAVAAGTFLAQEKWSTSPYSRVLLGALVACALTVDGIGLAGTLLFCALLVARHRLEFEPRLPSALIPLAWLAIALVIGTRIVGTVLLSTISLDATVSQTTDLTLADRLFIVSKESGWFIFPPMVGGAWYLLQNCPGSRRWLMLVVGAFALFMVGHWQRTSDMQAEEDYLREVGHGELASMIGPDNLVYWGSGHHILWLVLHRGSYASRQQASGIVFSRETAIEANRRLARLAKLGLPDSRFGWQITANTRASDLSTNLDGLIHVCHDPLLDFVVLPQLVAGASPVASMRLSPSAATHHIYACTSLRAVPDPFPSAA